MKKLFSIFILVLININFVFANFESFDAKSISDPLFIEIQENIYGYIPTEVTVHINDKVTKEKANYVDLNPYNDYPYSLSGGPIVLNSAGEFREVKKYNGESTIKFGFRPQGGIGTTSGIDVRFVYLEVVEDGDSGNPHDENSKYYGYDNCNYEQNTLICSNGNCKVCYKYISTVNRDYNIGGTNNSITFPQGLGEPTISPNDSYLSSVKEVSHKNGNGTYREYEKYSVVIWEQDTPLTETIDNYSPGKSWIMEKIGSPIGGESAFLFYTGSKIRNGGSDVTIQYELYSDMVPLNSGILYGRGSMNTFLYEGEKAAEANKIKNRLLQTMGSFKLSPGKPASFNGDLRHTYSLHDREYIEPKEEEEEFLVYGSITDIFDNPLPYMNIRVIIGEKTINTTTDEIGGFSVSLGSSDMGEKDIESSIILDFEYNRDDTIYFDLNFRKPNNTYSQALVEKLFTVKPNTDTEVRFKLNADPNDPSRRTSLGFTKDIKHSGVMYYHMHEVLDFYLRKLKLTLDYKLPVSVWVGNTQGSTSYRSTNSDIYIAANGASNSDVDRPKNREYHEFSHHVMFDLYGKRPSGDTLTGMVNHGGFYNPGTADSYIEGFAEFMALVVGDELGQDHSDIYAGFGSMEKNYRPWDGAGGLEEFAVASLLRDLYDNNNEEGDELYYSFDTIWDVLKVERSDFYEYYKAFKEKKPKDAEKIDKLFIKHGFFQDTREGNGKYDQGEPWRYIDEDAGTYKFIDLSDEADKIKYEKGFNIGIATNYERPERRSTVQLKDAFLQVKDNEVDFYTIKVSNSNDGLADYEYTVKRADGKVYVQPLPNNVEATITISPKSVDYKPNSIYTIQNSELVKKISNKDGNEGIFDKHEFDLKATGSQKDEHYEMFDNTPPSYKYKGDLDQELKTKKVDNNSSNSYLSLFIKILIAILLAVYGYFYYKSEKVKKNTAIVLRKIKEYSIIAWKWFIKYVVPFLKKTAKLIWKYIKIFVNYIVQLFKIIKEKKQKKKTTEKKKVAEKKK